MTVLTVSQLNRYVKAVLEADKKLADVYIKGEISNFVHHFRSGHFYFSLKDESGSVRAVMFKNNAAELRFEPENGMSVLVRANLGVYERDGVYQLYVTDIQPDGAGALGLAFEQLKRKLLERGLFDEAFKKPLPVYPVRIGVVTSQTGAAFMDIINVISRRYPLCTVVLAPAQVQGKEAPESLVKALKSLDNTGNCDVIIIGRGGGSAEDLFSFNDERLAYAIFEAVTPVVSAVGHEIDYTICDFAADVRAPTPSAAAELVTPQASALSQKLTEIRENLAATVDFKLKQSEKRMSELRRTGALSSPMNYVFKNQQRLDFFSQTLYNKKYVDLRRFGRELAHRASLLESLSPLGVLARGYCVAFRDNKAILQASSLTEGNNINIRFCDGSAKASILEVITNNEKKSDI